jgi:PPM family protein phosphatase
MPNDRPAQPPAQAAAHVPSPNGSEPPPDGSTHPSGAGPAEPRADSPNSDVPITTTPPTRINPNAGRRPVPSPDISDPAVPARVLDLATADYIGARSQQQDATKAQMIAGNAGALLVLADGLGGHESGAEAARIVVETFIEAASAGQFDLPEARRGALREALDRANARIADGVNPGHGQRSMASTAVAAVVADGALQWISVGDSHLYAWRAGQMLKLNQDHSQAGLMVRSGQYAPDDPEVLAAKSVLVSALTGRKLELVDHPRDAFRLETGDVLLLASDGLNTLSESEIEGIISRVEAGGAAGLSKVLLETVVERRMDRQDNTTVAIARVLDMPASADRVPLNELASIPLDFTTPARGRQEGSQSKPGQGSGGERSTLPQTAQRDEVSLSPATRTQPARPDADAMARSAGGARSSTGRRIAIRMLAALFIASAMALAGIAGVYAMYGNLDPIRSVARDFQAKLGMTAPAAPVPPAARAPAATKSPPPVAPPDAASPRTPAAVPVPPGSGSSSPAPGTAPGARPGAQQPATPPPTVSPGHAEPAQPPAGEKAPGQRPAPQNGRASDPVLVEPPRPVTSPPPR